MPPVPPRYGPWSVIGGAGDGAAEVMVNGRSRWCSTASRRTPRRWTSCATTGSPAARRAAPRASAAPARCWSPGPASTAPRPSGSRSTPAWCRSPSLDGQEVVTAEGLGTPTALHPVQQEMAGARRLAVRLLHARASSAAWRPSTTAPTARPCRRPQRRRTRAERLRPARAQRQPVPLHRLPADPRRGVRARRRRPTTTRSPYAGGAPAPPPAVTAAATGDGRAFVRPGRSGRRAASCCRERARTHGRRRVHRLGVEVNLRGSRAARWSSRSTGWPSCASSAVDAGRDRARRRAHADRDRATPGRAGAAAGRAVPAVRVAADPQRRDARRQPRHRLADRRHPARAARARAPSSSWPTLDGEREVALADYFTGYRHERAAHRRADPGDRASRCRSRR